ncbi:MAG: GNAT family N-acetyltransferase [Candidatus Paceibacterota bacterium]
MITKKVTQKDLPHILELLRSVRGDGRKISASQFLTAKEKNKIIGCVRVKELKDCLELGSLVVSPEYRNKGIGSKLVRSILLKEKRRPVYLLCFDKTACFYSKVGFSKIKTNLVPKTLRDEYLLVKGRLKKNNRKIVAMVIK